MSSLRSCHDRVLASVAAAPAPQTLPQIATDCGCGHSTVRRHLTALREAGLIARDTAPRRQHRVPATCGRDHYLYRAAS